MGVVNTIKLALAVMNFLNWLTTYVDRKQWEATGYAKAMTEAVAKLQARTGISEKAYSAARKAADAELDAELAS